MEGGITVGIGFRSHKTTSFRAVESGRFDTSATYSSDVSMLRLILSPINFHVLFIQEGVG